MTEKGTFKRKFKEEKKEELVSVDVGLKDAEEIDSLLEAIKNEKIEGVFTPDDEHLSLLEVTDCIPMPKPLANVMACEGIPYGRIIQVVGKKDSGKTTFATLALKENQEIGGLSILLDTEQKFSLKRAAAMGVDTKKLLVIQADTIEDAFEKFLSVVMKAKDFAPDRKVLCVWDSLGNTPSKAEMDADVKDFAMNAARAIKGNLRKLTTQISKSKIAFVIINQLYANMATFGKKTTPYGGSGPAYSSSIILEFVNMGRVRPKGVKADDGHFAGTKIQIECTKNHVGQPFRKVELAIDWKGFVIDRGVEYAPE